MPEYDGQVKLGLGVDLDSASVNVAVNKLKKDLQELNNVKLNSQTASYWKELRVAATEYASRVRDVSKAHQLTQSVMKNSPYASQAKDLNKLDDSIAKTQSSIAKLESKLNDIAAGIKSTGKVSDEFKALDKEIMSTRNELELLSNSKISISIPSKVTQQAKDLRSYVTEINRVLGTVFRPGQGYGETSVFSVQELMKVRDKYAKSVAARKAQGRQQDSGENVLNYLDSLIPKADVLTQKLEALNQQRAEMIQSGYQFEFKELTAEESSMGPIYQTQLDAQNEKLSELVAKREQILAIQQAELEYEQHLQDLRQNAIVINQDEVDKQQQIADIQAQIAAKQSELASYKQGQADLESAGVGGPGYASWVALQKAIEQTENSIAKLNKELRDAKSKTTSKIVDEKEYERAKKISDMLDDLIKKREKLKQLQEKQQANVASGNIAGTQDYIDTAKEISATEAEINNLAKSLSKLGVDTGDSQNRLSGWVDIITNVLGRVLPGFSGKLKSVMSIAGELSATVGQAAGSVSETGAAMSSAAGTAGTLASVLGTVAAALGGVVAAIAFGYNYFNKAMNVGKQFLSQVLSKFSSLVQRAANALQSFARAAVKPIQLIGTLTKRVKKSIPSFKKLFNLIIKYGFGVRSTYFLFRKFRTMVTEGFGVMSKSSKQFNSALTNIISTWNQMKGQVSAIGEPIVKAIEPLLTMLIEKLTAAALAITKFVGAALGFKQVLRATKVIKDYANSVGSANKQLAGFDELNNLTSGSGNADYGYEWVESDPTGKVAEWIAKFKEAWEKGDLTEIGRDIATRIGAALDSIPWDQIKTKARQVTKNIATLLTGLMKLDSEGNISSSLFAKFGHTFAEALNTISQAIAGFLEGFSFEDLGDSIRYFIEEFYATIDWDTISDNISNGINGIVTTISRLTELDWGFIGQDLGMRISDTVHKISWENLGKTIGNGFVSALRFIGGVIQGADLSGLVTDIATAFSNIDWDKIGETFADIFNTLGDDVGNLANKLGGYVPYAIENTPITPEQRRERNPIYRFISSLIENIDFNSLLLSLAALVDQFIKDAGAILPDLINKLLDPETGIDMAELGKNIGIIVEDLLWALYDTLDQNKDALIQGISNFLKGIDTQNFAAIIILIVDEIFDIALQSGLIGEIGAFITTIGAQIKTKILQLKIAVFTQSLLFKLITWIKQFLGGLPDALKAPLNKILTKIEAFANCIIDIFNHLGSIIAENLNFEVPSWVKYIPGVPNEIAGQKLSAIMPTLPHITIPKLAKGAVIPPNKEFMAVLGDQKSGTNIETPLGTMIEAFNAALNQNSPNEELKSLMLTQIELLRVIAAKEFGITDKAIANSVRRSNSEWVKQTGHSLI